MSTNQPGDLPQEVRVGIPRKTLKRLLYSKNFNDVKEAAEMREKLAELDKAINILLCARSIVEKIDMKSDRK